MMRPIDADVMRDEVKVNPWATAEAVRQAELIKEWVDAQPTLEMYENCMSLVVPTPVHDVLAPSGIAYTCNHCSVTIIRRFKYCPACGHKIDWNSIDGK